jgi:hypothetical protein
MMYVKYYNNNNDLFIRIDVALAYTIKILIYKLDNIMGLHSRHL